MRFPMGGLRERLKRCLVVPAVVFFLIISVQVVAGISEANAALYWFHGVRNKEISLCFSGDAVSVRPDRVQEIVGHLQRFEEAANIRFMTLAGTSAQEAIDTGGNLQDLACPSIVPVLDGKNYYEGDIRVAIFNTNVPVTPAEDLVPGLGCTQTRGSSSWSNPPDELDIKRCCQYNLKLGDDDLDMTQSMYDPKVHTGTPWLNHTLHEFGHALGLSHEHARSDENAKCVPSGNGEFHIATSGYITPYDKNSIMHYRFWPEEYPQCTDHIGTNYSNEGLTAYDKLALRIMYPEDQRVAEFNGRTVVKVGEIIDLRSRLVEQGATPFAINTFHWYVDGNLRSTGDRLNIAFEAAGEHPFVFSCQDFLARTYTYSGKLVVLTNKAYYDRMAALQNASLLMMNVQSMTPFPWSKFLPAFVSKKESN